MGSPTVAKRAKQAGGDAVILEKQDEAGSAGGAGYSNSILGLMAMGGSKTLTAFVVIKYLPGE